MYTIVDSIPLPIPYRLLLRKVKVCVDRVDSASAHVYPLAGPYQCKYFIVIEMSKHDDLTLVALICTYLAV